MDVMRLTVIDAQGTVSFVARTSAARALAAACAADPSSLDDLLRAVERYDRGLRAMVLDGLAVFDRHNRAADLRIIHGLLVTLPAREAPVFRVLDAVTLQASLEPVRAGVVLYNLLDRRIVQIQNTEEPLARAGQVNYHTGQFLSTRRFEYTLPDYWQIVP